MTMSYAIVVPWVREEEIAAFLGQWGIGGAVPDWLVLQRDDKREGCGATKNKGIARATSLGAETVVVLDGDCYPSSEARTLAELAEKHVLALEPQRVEMFQMVTDPPSRGTPYSETTIEFSVAASMGFWTGVGDYCAVRQFALGSGPMTFARRSVFGRYFPLCGMNLAFRPKEWLPWCCFIEVPRFDDIWMGWLWQREAYRRNYCFNLDGPLVHHSRQSNAWKNLRDEALHLEENETLWRRIAVCDSSDYESLRRLLPC
jgi:hypothetical protein